jgi:DNA-binding transcriptional MocR family regulator
LLLMSLDRLASDELTMTHEMLANTLGVRREGVTEAAHKLQSAGFIAYRRGRITVLDRIGVEACSCECYRVMRREYDRPRRPYAYTIDPTSLEPGAAHSCT